jgi:hypothetical protein
MGLGEGQRHSRPLQVYNMHNVPSGSECLALWCFGNEKKLCGLAHVLRGNTCGGIITSDGWWDKKDG